jgi:hypothetical protein
MAAAQKCPRCLGLTKQPWLVRDPEDAELAMCPVCKFKMPNRDHNILFKGRPPGSKNREKENVPDAT